MDRTLHILHIEDDPRDAELVEATLLAGDVRCEVRRVETREQYESALEGGGVDLVLSDFTLPGYDGASALAFTRARHPEIPFIVVSGTIGEDAAIESMLAGATDYVMKHRLGRLVPAVSRALREADERRARRQAEKQVRASELSYRRLFESSKDGLLILDAASGRIVDANPFLLELLGYTKDELVGHTLAEVDLAGDDPAGRAFEELLANGEGRFPDLRLLGRDGRVVEVDAVASAYALEDRRTIQCAVRDISERRKLEGQLLQSQKVEAVGQLASGVAHDFNNLLAVINSYTELALGSLSPEDPLHEDLEQVQEAGTRAAALTRQLLAFSRRKVQQPVVLSLNEVARGIEKMLRRVIGETIDLRLHLAADLGNVRADPAHLEQVLLNLVLNARDAMPRGGSLVIETANVTLDEAGAREHPDAKPGAYVLLAVADTGCGMDASTRARIFEPFYTTKAPGKGTGLGLPTVHGIVKQSGGYVSVSSELGKGATFRIHLPRDASQAAEPRAHKPIMRGGTETVLVVEDDPDVRRLLQRVLRPAGYAVLCAASGAEALQLDAAHPGPIQLLVTDVVMPAMDGSAVAERLRRSRPQLRVLYMSGYLDEAVAARGPEGRGRDFIHKPFSAGDLLAKIREVLDRRAA
jgi:two-component system cell cycle sensor histidine kinase/response regulator CckA